MPKIILAARGRITTYFKQDIGRGFLHNGVDQGHGNGAAIDLEIKAPAAGVVIAVGVYGSYGKRIIIRHDDGTTSLLAHHAKQFVVVGQRVTQGQIIAVMGNSGTVFVHSHQEYRDAAGNQLDPLENLGISFAAESTAVINTATVVATLTGLEKMQIILHTNTTTGDQLHYLISDTEVLDLAGAGQDEIDTYAAVWGPVIAVHDHRFNYIKNAIGINKSREQSALLAAVTAS